MDQVAGEEGRDADTTNMHLRATARTVTPRRAWLETAAITALSVGIGYLVEPHDPFFLQRFPWLVLAPLLIGLQNGARYALVSSLALLAGSGLYWSQVQGATGAFPFDHAACLILLGPLAGEYRSTWEQDLARWQLHSREHAARLQRLSTEYRLLEHSHADLEQRLAASGHSPDSLQHALARLGSSMSGHEGGVVGAAERILQMIGRYSKVHSATVHAVHGTSVAPEPLAALGTSASAYLNASHPMVRDAVMTGELTHVGGARARAGVAAPLVCLPLCDSRGRVRGVVLIHHMPFMDMHEHELRRLAVLGMGLGDWLCQSTPAQS